MMTILNPALFPTVSKHRPDRTGRCAACRHRWTIDHLKHMITTHLGSNAGTIDTTATPWTVEIHEPLEPAVYTYIQDWSDPHPCRGCSRTLTKGDVINAVANPGGDARTYYCKPCWDEGRDDQHKQ